MALAVLCISFVLCLLIGLPVAVAIGLSCLATFFVEGLPLETAIQMMTSRGGWPMNVVCLPNGKPIWGGTYFRKTEWIDYLNQLQDLYLKNPEKLIEYSEKLYSGLEELSLISNNEINLSLIIFTRRDILICDWSIIFANIQCQQ